MGRNPPQPSPQAFLLCREIVQDRKTGKNVLITPFWQITLPAFPVAYRLSIYLLLTGCQGTYRIALQLRDDEGYVAGEYPAPQSMRHNDPLIPHTICWQDIAMKFPRAGRFDVVVMANGEDVAHHFVDVVLRANQ